MDMLIQWLRDHDWPVPDGDMDELTFEQSFDEMSYVPKDALGMGLYQLQPIPGLTFTVFIVDAQQQNIPNIPTLERFADHFTNKKYLKIERTTFNLESLVFFVICRSSRLFVCHLSSYGSSQTDAAIRGPIDLNDSNIVPQFEWSQIKVNGIPIDDIKYLTYNRRRTRNRCTRRFIERFAPDYLALFDLASKRQCVRRKDEVRLFNAYRTGDKRALDIIAGQSLRKVFDVASSIFHSYAICKPSFDAIFSGALNGMMSSIPRYDSRIAHAFAIYSWPRIYQHGIRAMVSSLDPFPIPMYVWDRISPAIKACTEEAKLTGKDFETTVVPEFQKLTATDRIVVLFLISRHIHGNPTDCLHKDPNDEIAFDTLSTEWVSEFDRMTQELLTLRESDVLRLRYGIYPNSDGTGRTLEEIGTIFCITRERVRQIEMRAIKKLAKPIAVKANEITQSPGKDIHIASTSILN